MSEARAKTASDPLDLPPDSAPIFGEAQSLSAPGRAVTAFPATRALRMNGQHHGGSGGRCALPSVKGSGVVRMLPASRPGLVHIDADITYDAGGAVRYEADVRESWLARLSRAGDCSPASILKAVVELAGLPRQTTVRVHPQP
ncbi:MAG TPA: hypothetical protein PKD27_06710 [Tepidiformaceae bacterium]|nr:hypothetical protein [Tepidiformaceae bacterium]